MLHATKIKLFPSILVLYELVVYLSMDMYLPALPQMQAEFSASTYQVQSTLMSWLIGSASMQLILGPISDSIGRRKILISGGFLFIIATFICATASSINILLFGRFLQGSTVCSVVIAGYATIHELFEHKRAITILAWMNGLTVLAPAFGPFLGGLILQVADWHWIFYLIFIWSCINVALIIKIMPESHHVEKRNKIKLKSVFHGYIQIISNTAFISHILAFCCLFAGIMIWHAAGPFLIITKLRHSGIIFGLLQTLIYAFFIIATHLVPYLQKKIGTENLIKVGLLIAFSSGILSLICFALPLNKLFSLMLGLSIFFFGAGLCFAPLHRVGIESSSQLTGIKMAVFSSCMNLFGVIGCALVNAFYDGNALSIMLLVTFMALLAILAKYFKPLTMFRILNNCSSIKG